MDSNRPAEHVWNILERRELRFSPAALQVAISWSLETATVNEWLPAAPDAIGLVPEENRVNLLYGRGAKVRTIPLRHDLLGSMLIAYCIRVHIPLRRVARKEVHIKPKYVALVFHVEHTRTIDAAHATMARA